MDRIEEIREKIGECDDIIIEQLAVRMSHIQEIISYKKATGIPILQPEQEKKQTDALAQKLGDNEFEEEILDIFKYIMKNSRRIQSKSLFDYNIFLIGFMGAGKSTIAGELKDKLEMDRVEMDQMIVEKQGMSISEIFDEYGEAYFRNLESNTLIELQKRKQTIVSCGGGVVMREENTDHMKKNGRVVLLTAKPETIYERVKDSDERPILNDHMNVEFISSLMDKRKVDVSIKTFVRSLVNILLTILLIISVVGALGVETTSFAALLASAGVAVGMALSGNLQNFAGGLVILLFKPYKVGDWIETQQGSAGTVKEIQIFHTILTTGDNKLIYIPNGSLSSGVVINYSHQETRRVEWIIGIDYGEDYNKVQQIVRDILAEDKRILNEPAPFIALHALDASSVNVVVRVWVNSGDYWGVYFDTNKAIYETFNEKGINFPFPQLTVHQGN